MSSVLPGVEDVFARLLWLQSMFIRLDLPTFERPMKAYSFFVSLGHFSIVGLLSVKAAVFISMMSYDFLLFFSSFFILRCGSLASG